MKRIFCNWFTIGNNELRLVLGSIFVFSALVVESQVLDDSTKLVYGPKTTKFTTGERIMWNDTTMNTIDTGLHHFEKPFFKEQQNFLYQDLGNNGTALFSLLYELPRNTGLYSGFNAYDHYFLEPENFKYYDTKSPFFEIYSLFGGNGRSDVDFNYSRNVNYRWNVGCDIHRITTDHQIGELRSRDDRNVISTSYDVYTYYKDSLDRYTLLFHALGFDHQVRESGGINTFNEQIKRPQQLRDRENRTLTTALAIDKRNRLHLYQQYDLRKQFQLYWAFDRNVQKFSYFDNLTASNFNLYGDTIFYDPNSVESQSIFREIKNEVGIKGDIGPVFYSGYLKRRDIKQFYTSINPYNPTKNSPFEGYNENYLGGRLKMTVKEVFQLRGRAEVNSNGDFLVNSRLDNKILKVTYKMMNYAPTILQQYYFDNYKNWDNDGFDRVFGYDLRASLNTDFKSIKIRPYLYHRVYNNWTFFDSTRTPRQHKEFTLNSFGFWTGFSFAKRVHIENDLLYTLVGEELENDLVRVPRINWNGKIFYTGSWFNRTVPVELGFNFYGRQGYLANLYDPSIQQFYLQNTDGSDFGNLNTYVTIDAYFNAQIDKIILFFRRTHLNQDGGNIGYYSTPFYAGQQSLTDFGVKWLFFD